MTTYVKTYLATIELTVYKDLLGETKYDIANMEDLLTNLIEGDYNENIVLNNKIFRSPLLVDSFNRLEQLTDWTEQK